MRQQGGERKFDEQALSSWEQMYARVRVAYRNKKAVYMQLQLLTLQAALDSQAI